MKLIKLKVGDKFMWKGVKYQVFMKIKRPIKAYKIPCVRWPCEEIVDMPSGREVKPVIRMTTIN